MMAYYRTLTTLWIATVLVTGCAVDGWEQPDLNDPDIVESSDVGDEWTLLDDAHAEPAPALKSVGAISTTPIALGTVLDNGSKYQGSSNWLSTYNWNYGRYEISISGENYYYLRYVTNVTPAGDARFCKTSSVSGMLLVYCYNSAGSRVRSRFQFLTFKM